jgi:hypothetical protein
LVSNGFGRNGAWFLASVGFMGEILSILFCRVPDLVLTVQHPKRAFMRRAIEFEIRLAYHDRILKTLPESMQAKNAYVISEQAPGPAYEYEDPSKF